MRSLLEIKIALSAVFVIFFSSAFAEIKSADAPREAGGFIYKDRYWGSYIVGACFLENDTEYLIEKKWVKDAVENSWMMNSGIFVWFYDKCPSNFVGITIKIEDSGPRSFVGTDAVLNTPSMHLNFEFRETFTWCRTNRENCIKAIAIHEFGHALGLLHEQARPENIGNAICSKSDKSDEYYRKFGEKTGPYDHESVMNYCSGNVGRPYPLSLSAGDISTIQSLYLAPDRVFMKLGNNGTASCEEFCKGDQWPGGTGSCVGAHDQRNFTHRKCSDKPGYLGGATLICMCSRR